MNRNVRFEDEQMELAAGALFDKLGFAGGPKKKMEDIASTLAWVGTNIRNAHTAFVKQNAALLADIKAALKGKALKFEDFEAKLRSSMGLYNRLLGRMFSKSGLTPGEEDLFARVAIDLENLPFVAMYVVKGEEATRKALVERHEALVEAAAKELAKKITASVELELARGAEIPDMPPQEECDTYINALCDLFESAVAYKGAVANGDIPAGVKLRGGKRTANTLEPIAHRVEVMSNEIKYSRAEGGMLRRVYNNLREAMLPDDGIRLRNLVVMGSFVLFITTLLTGIVGMAYAPAPYANTNVDGKDLILSHIGIIGEQMERSFEARVLENRAIYTLASTFTMNEMQQRDADVEIFEQAKGLLRKALDVVVNARLASEKPYRKSEFEHKVRDLLDDDVAIPIAIAKIRQDAIDAGDSEEQAHAFTPTQDEIIHLRVFEIRDLARLATGVMQDVIQDAADAMELNRLMMLLARTLREDVASRKPNALGTTLRVAMRSAGGISTIVGPVIHMMGNFTYTLIDSAISGGMNFVHIDSSNPYLKALAYLASGSVVSYVLAKTREKLIHRAIDIVLNDPLTQLPESIRPSYGTIGRGVLYAVGGVITYSFFRALVPMLMHVGTGSLVPAAAGAAAIHAAAWVKYIEAVAFNYPGAYYAGFGNVVRRSAVGFTSGALVGTLVFWGITWGLATELTTQADIAVNHPQTFELQQRLASATPGQFFAEASRFISIYNIEAPQDAFTKNYSLPIYDAKLARWMLDNGANPLNN